MYSDNNMVLVNNKNWYIETKTGFEGPFESENEAKIYLNLVNSADAARVEFAGLQFSPLN